MQFSYYLYKNMTKMSYFDVLSLKLAIIYVKMKVSQMIEVVLRIIIAFMNVVH